MKKKSILSLFVLTVMFIGGCGKDRVPPDSFYEYMSNPKNKEPVKHVREDQARSNRSDFSVDEDPEYETTDFLVSDSTGKFRVKVTSEYVYFVFEHNSTAPNMQFIMDMDNSLATGYKPEGGAEYIIENNKLYRSLDTDKWNWKEVEGVFGRISVITKMARMDIVRLSIDMFKKDGKFQPFSVSAQALDKNWVPVVVAPLNYTKLVVDNTKYSISDTPVLAFGSYKDQTLGVLKNDAKIEIYLSALSYDPYMQIYLDTDLDATTGYKNPDIEGFGADYMIEEGILYKSNAKSQWGWIYVQPLYVTSWREDSKVAMKISVDKKSLNLANGDGFNIYMESNDIDWTKTRFLPQDGTFVRVK